MFFQMFNDQTHYKANRKRISLIDFGLPIILPYIHCTDIFSTENKKSMLSKPR